MLWENFRLSPGAGDSEVSEGIPIPLSFHFHFHPPLPSSPLLSQDY